MANLFNWSLGHEGKGNVYPNEDISTWNIDETGAPHHEEKAAAENEDYPVFKFYISPEGGIHDGGLGFENQTAHTDDQVIERIVSEDTALYDARDEELGDLDAEPRVEQPGGGYGHAYNLLEMMSKLGALDNNGWADFHTELKLPRGVRRKIREWVNRLDWPEGSEQEDARRYHITILSMDEYDEDFADWAREQIRGKVFTFESSGMEIFGDEHVVLRVECPEWTELVLRWQEKAERDELEPRKFDPPKAHITVGTTPDGKWPQGIPDPHLEFDTRMFNINKNSMTGLQFSTGGDQIGPEYHGYIVARIGNEQVGKLDYTYYQGELGIRMVEVDPAYRRNGIADALLAELKKDDPSPIYSQGDFNTDEGQAWLDKNNIGQWSGQDPFSFEADVLPHPDETRTASNSEYWDKEVGHPHNEFTEMVPTEAMLPYREFDRPLKDDLRDHIAQHGIVGSIKLEYNPKTEMAHIGEGNHRLKAAQELGISHVPVEVLRTTRGPFGVNYPDKDFEGSANLKGAPVPTPPVPDQFDYIPGNMKPSDIGLPVQGVEKQASEHEITPADELAKWLQSFPAQEEAQPLSIHHTDEGQIAPQRRSPVAEGPHIDPPSHPYKPYDWASEGWTESPLDRTANDQLELGEQYCPACFSTAIADGGTYSECLDCGHIESKDEPSFRWPRSQEPPSPTEPNRPTLFASRTSAMTRKKKLELMHQIENRDVQAPDQSIIVHEFPNGWSIRQLRTYGDAMREGQLMGNCFSPLEMEPESHHPIWEQHPEALWDNTSMDPYAGEEGTYLGIPEDADLSHSVPAHMYSLRDPDNYPHMSSDDNATLGMHNVEFEEAKPEYQQMWDEWEVAHQKQRADALKHTWTSALDVCPNCGGKDGTPCKVCGYDELQPGSDYENAKNHWYDTAWDKPGSPRPFPSHPEHWRHDNARDVKFSKEMNDLDYVGGRDAHAEPRWNRRSGQANDLSAVRDGKSSSRGTNQGTDADPLPRMWRVLPSPAASLGWDSQGWREI
jgi:2'-5' RNA ligase